jgi:hypothetical protein
MLATMAEIVSTVGSGRVKPSVYFSPTAQQISKSPATNRSNHAILSWTLHASVCTQRVSAPAPQPGLVLQFPTGTVLASAATRQNVGGCRMPPGVDTNGNGLVLQKKPDLLSKIGPAL